MTVTSLLALITIAQLGAQQSLRDPSPVSLWLEATGGEQHCDWYLAGHDILNMPVPERTATLDGCELQLRLRGNLNIAGARYFDGVSDALSATTAQPQIIVLDSQGGEADAAFRIAERIRRDPLYRRRDGGVITAIDDTFDAVCLSSCLFIFAAGFERQADFDILDGRLASRMGIHRPAQMRRRDGSFDTDAANPEVLRVERAMRDFFTRVGVSTQIVDDMFDVPFNEIHVITREEAEAYGLVTGPARQ